MLDAEEETDSPYDSCSGEAVDSAEKQREGGLAVDPTRRIHAVEENVPRQGWRSLIVN